MVADGADATDVVEEEKEEGEEETEADAREKKDEPSKLLVFEGISKLPTEDDDSREEATEEEEEAELSALPAMPPFVWFPISTLFPIPFISPSAALFVFSFSFALVVSLNVTGARSDGSAFGTSTRGRKPSGSEAKTAFSCSMERKRLSGKGRGTRRDSVRYEAERDFKDWGDGFGCVMVKSVFG